MPCLYPNTNILSYNKPIPTMNIEQINRKKKREKNMKYPPRFFAPLSNGTEKYRNRARGRKIQNGARRSRQLKLLATSHVCGAEMHARACTCAPRYARAKSWGRLFFEETGNVASRNNDRVENTSSLETFRVAPAAQFTTIKAEALALAPCTSSTRNR